MANATPGDAHSLALATHRRDEALRALRRTYGWQLAVAMLVDRLRGLSRERVVRELTPSAAA